MKLHDVRAGADEARGAEDLAARFLEALFSGRIDAARRLAGPGFSWFGDPAPDWDGQGIRRFVAAAPTEVGSVRRVPPEVLDLLDPETRDPLLGPLEPRHCVVLADVDRGGQTTTSGLVVDPADESVARVLDATPLKRALERVG